MTASAVADEGALVQLSKAFMDAAHRSPTIFDLDTQTAELLARLETAETPEDLAALEQELAQNEQAIQVKVSSYCHVIRTLEHMADARKAEADRLTQRAESAQAHAKWLRERLLVHMRIAGLQRLETSLWTVSVRTNPPAVTVVDPSAVPGEFQRTKVIVEVDKRAILDAIKKDGVVVPGVTVTRGERISIS